MNRNKKNLHKTAVNVLGITLASVMAAGTVGELAAPIPVFAAQTQNKETERTVYLNGSAKDSEKADGSTKENAVNSLGKALELVGEQGTIVVYGMVTIDSEVKLTIPSGVTLKRDKEFEGKLIKLTGKGTLTIIGQEISAEDVDVTSAEAGKDAFQIKAPENNEDQDTSNKPSETPEEPSKEEQPEETSEAEQKPEETPEAEQPEQEPEETPEAEQPEQEPEETPEEEQPEQKPEETPEAEQPEQKPEETPEAEQPEQKPEETPEAETKKPASLEVPQELVLKTKEEWNTFDFAAAGFTGEGTFAWDSLTEPETYENQMTVRFTPKDLEESDYSQVPGWEEETKTVVRSVKVFIEELKEPEAGDAEKPEETPDPEQPEQQPEETPQEEVTIIPVDPNAAEAEPEAEPEKPENTAQPGKLGEVAEEAPESIPVGSLIDESGVQVSGDFLPFYVDLQVSYNEAVNELPDAGIGEILSAYELKLWDLKENTEYQIPEGKKVKVLIPLPENADCYSDLSIAHYLGNNQYEYFIFDKDGKVGNMTVEEKDGVEYLAFETASFSPFNVGGHQIVGPGISSGGHKPSTGTGSTGNTGTSTGTGTGTNQGTGSQTGQSAGNGTTQKKPTQTTSNGSSSNVTVIHTVKTGDDTEITRYALLGAGALALGAGAAVAGRKKKKSK